MYYAIQQITEERPVTILVAGTDSKIAVLYNYYEREMFLAGYRHGCSVAQIGGTK